MVHGKGGSGPGGSQMTPRKKPLIVCCQHYNHSHADVLGVRFSLCRDCGHRWQEWPL